jgi:tRNA-dihydrouridine synthase B
LQEFIRPLVIGNLSFENNLIQGPLAGYSCAPFRRLFYRFQSPAYCCTEMISAQDLVKNKNSKKRFIFRDPAEKYLCYQLGGYDIQYLRDAAKYAVDCGADLIDINCGCPKPKIRKKRMGSYLLNYPDHIAKIIETIKEVVSVPVTVKIRVMKPGNEKNNTLQTVKMITEAGADAIIVHGRHWLEDYTVPCHLEMIAEIVNSTKIPIIGNGDVGDVASLKKMFATTQCAGVMISRAGTGKPWIYEQIMMQAKGEEFTLPALSDVKSLFLEHIEKLIEIENEMIAFLQSRNIFRYYFGKKISDENFVAYCELKNIRSIPEFLESIN